MIPYLAFHAIASKNHAPTTHIVDLHRYVAGKWHKIVTIAKGL